MRVCDRVTKTLSFSNEGLDRGATMETLFPWKLTCDRWEKDGLAYNPFAHDIRETGLTTRINYEYNNKPIPEYENYYNTMMTDALLKFDNQFEIDPMLRMGLRVPFQVFEETIFEDNDEFTFKQEVDGWHKRHYKKRDLVEEVRPPVVEPEDWEAMKPKIIKKIQECCTKENAAKTYGKYKDITGRGDCTVRFRLAGFFWTPRDLMGNEGLFMAFYEYPELLHDINKFILKFYMEHMENVLEYINPETICIQIEEDLSGKTGPMISPATFDEFVGDYYRVLVPFLHDHGIKHVFVDTDGDFMQLIPSFIESGIDSFLPVDVNAGMDVVKVRQNFPKLKLIGAFNKLCIQAGPEEIDREFERLKPVIMQGGFIPITDHQPSPGTSLENYRYYNKRLNEVMRECRGEGKEILVP